MKRKSLITIVAIILAFSCVSGTMAFLIDITSSLQNTFEPSKIDVEIREDFDGSEKKNIKVSNIGTADAYIRIRLVSYWYNASDQVVAKDSWFEDVELHLGDGWLKLGDYYYYTKPLAPNGQTENPLFTDAILLGKDTQDNTFKVLEILAEAIQANPVEAVESAWPAVKVGANGLEKKEG